MRSIDEGKGGVFVRSSHSVNDGTEDDDVDDIVPVADGVEDEEDGSWESGECRPLEEWLGCGLWMKPESLGHLTHRWGESPRSWEDCLKLRLSSIVDELLMELLLEAKPLDDVDSNG